METHVKTLGVLHIALGILGTLGALVVIVIFGGAAALIGASDVDVDARIAVPVVGIVGTIIALFILLVSLPGIVAGVGLLKFRPWARIMTIILAALNLLNLPFGTALGIYALWVLLPAQTERLFASHQAA